MSFSREGLYPRHFGYRQVKLVSSLPGASASLEDPRYLADLEVRLGNKSTHTKLPRSSSACRLGCQFQPFCSAVFMQEDGLYCRVCNMYFSSVHNRKEHVLGSKHLSNITGEYFLVKLLMFCCPLRR